MKTNDAIAPDIETLRSILRYDPETGKLYWRERTADLFPNKAGRAIFNARNAGKEVVKRNNGYVIVKITINQKKFELCGHRVAWAMHTGCWPINDIDHKNRVRDDNRFENIREATRIQNHHNKAVMANNKSGIKGAYFSKQAGKWRASIKVGNSRKHLGTFDSPEKAGEAYAAASKAFHGEFSNT